MIFTQIINKVLYEKKEKGITHMIFFFRYVSLAAASLFFLIGSTELTIDRKIFIVACIGISAVIVNHLYIMNQKSKSKTLLLLLIETVGNSIILIPSGGLSSPYVWYSLNTILITSLLLDWKYCWLNVFIYLFDSTYLLQLLIEKSPYILLTLKEQSNLILSFILITVVIETLSLYAKNLEYKSRKLTDANSQLTIANAKIKQLMGYTMELYQAVHLFTTQQNRKDLIELIIDCAEKVTKSSSVLFIYTSEEKLKIDSKYLSSELKDEIMWKRDAISSLSKQGSPAEIILQTQPWLFAPVKCNYKTFGALGIKLNIPDYPSYKKEILDHTGLLCSLSAIVLEKFELEQINNKLLINEERNRIANEIHDSILQRLFSVSCGIFGVIRKTGKDNTADQINELNLIRNTINEVMKDLRSTIYGYSSSKNGISNFIDGINKYINETKSLNNININFKVEGNHDHLSSGQKNALYRIICESCGNAIRHGKAIQIDILLSISCDYTKLDVKDNGAGFDTHIFQDKDTLGLGIENIHNLVHYLGGKINYTSEIGRGSTVSITLPNNADVCKEEAV